MKTMNEFLKESSGFNKKLALEASKHADKLEKHDKPHEYVKKIPYMQLQYLKHHNMGQSGANPHSMIKHIDKEIQDRHDDMFDS